MGGIADRVGPYGPGPVNVRELQVRSHAYARSNGFWDAETNPTVEGKLMLVVSELAEALEEHRSGNPLSYSRADGKPEGIASELADAVIRLADLAEHLGVDLDESIRTKHAYNLTRPFRHGKSI
jgi:NTP pyrophosphatase (non-canonical NTP hydrolase)